MKRIAFLYAVLFFCGIASVRAADWPMFRGGNGENKSLETGLLQSWPEGGPKLLWKASGLGKSSKPTGYASVVIADGRIFTTGNVDKQDNPKEAEATIYCLDEKTGKELWSAPIGEGWMGHFEGERGTPTVDGDRIYALAAKGELTCFDVKDGNRIWTRNLAADYEVTLPQWAYAQSPVIDGKNVIVGVGGKKASVVAMDKMNGNTVWETPSLTFESVKEGEAPKTETERAGYATGNVFEQDGLRMLAMMDQKAVLLVDATNGKLLARFPHETKHDINANVPIYLDGKLLVTSGVGTTGTQLLKVNVDGDKATLERIWQQKKLDTNHGGHVVLEVSIYGSSQAYKGNAWLCIRLSDGEIMWEAKPMAMGSTAYADGRVYCYDEKEGNVVLLIPTPEKYDPVGRFTLPEDGQGNFWAHPVICGKRLYLRRDTFLYCYDVAEK